jgi:hypothetical protein
MRKWDGTYSVTQKEIIYTTRRGQQVEREDQESRIGLREDHGWMNSTVSTGETEVKGEDRECERGDHGWFDSMVGTGEMVVE